MGLSATSDGVRVVILKGDPRAPEVAFKKELTSPPEKKADFGEMAGYLGERLRGLILEHEVESCGVRLADMVNPVAWTKRSVTTALATQLRLEGFLLGIVADHGLQYKAGLTKTFGKLVGTTKPAEFIGKSCNEWRSIKDWARWGEDFRKVGLAAVAALEMLRK